MYLCPHKTCDAWGICSLLPCNKYPNKTLASLSSEYLCATLIVLATLGYTGHPLDWVYPEVG